MSNIYRTIINEAASLPKREPRPTPKPMKKSLMTRLLEKRNLKADTKTVAEAVYNIAATAAFGTRVLEEKVPVTRLHRHMCLHLNRFVAEAMIREGRLPMNIYVVDRFLSHIDFGHGRVISIRVQLHTPDTKRTTRSSIIVQEAKMEPPWDEVFNQFDLVDRIPFGDGQAGNLARKEDT